MSASNLVGTFSELSRPSTFAVRMFDFNPNPRQAEVQDSQQLRGILCCSRQRGRSTTVAAKAVHHAVLTPDSLVVVIAPTLRQSAELLKTMRRFVRRCGQAPATDSGNKFSMVLPNRARILALPADEDNIRGFASVSLLIIDEAARVPDPSTRLPFRSSPPPTVRSGSCPRQRTSADSSTTNGSRRRAASSRST